MQTRRKIRYKLIVVGLLTVVLLENGCAHMKTQTSTETQYEVVTYKKSEKLILAEEKEAEVNEIIAETVKWAMENEEDPISKQIVTISLDMRLKNQELEEAKRNLAEERKIAEEEQNYKRPEFKKAKENWKEKSAEYNLVRHKMYTLSLKTKK